MQIAIHGQKRSLLRNGKISDVALRTFLVLDKYLNAGSAICIFFNG